MPPIKTQCYERLLCRFNGEEKMEKAVELSTLLQDVSEMEDDLKSVKKSMEAQMQEKKARINKLAEDLRTGTEFRSVECHWQYDWDAGTKTQYRDDNNEVIKEEQITDEERQTQLELQEESVAGEQADAEAQETEREQSAEEAAESEADAALAAADADAEAEAETQAGEEENPAESQ